MSISAIAVGVFREMRFQTGLVEELRLPCRLHILLVAWRGDEDRSDVSWGGLHPEVWDADGKCYRTIDIFFTHLRTEAPTMGAS
ncbi:MAG: hypothetical protein METHAR1v1_1240002 [Methanothrix sp.]|nr:MAG: hypothetical protein METHAR1v1_1240002 [Methanothrix sp.]